MTERTEFARLLLQIERASVTRTHLRALLAAAGATLVGLRRELRNHKVRMARASAPHNPSSSGKERRA